MQILTGHESPQTPYVIADYPYGFKLRCALAVWVETRPGFGERIVRQTSNPRRPGIWNKPKAGRYAPVRLLALDDTGRLVDLTPNVHDPAALAAWEDQYGAHLTPYQRSVISALLAQHRAMRRVRFSIHACPARPCGDPVHSEPFADRQRREARLIDEIINYEMKREYDAREAGEPFDRLGRDIAPPDEL